MLDHGFPPHLRHALPRPVLVQLAEALAAGQPPDEAAEAASGRLLAFRPALPLALAREMVADALDEWRSGRRMPCAGPGGTDGPVVAAGEPP